MLYTDAHCHIVPPVPKGGEIAGCICNAVRESEWANFAENADEENFVCIGVHPWYLKDITDGWQSRMEQILYDNPNVMVGEIGLDKHHDDMPRQIKVFTEQLEIAARCRRPVHLHCVGAWDKVLHILKDHANNLPPVILAHGFNGSPDLIEKLANEYNMLFSYRATYQNDDKLYARVLTTPVDRLLVESDADTTLAQGEILKTTVQQISGVLCCAPDELCAQIYMNFQRMISYVRTIDQA